MKKFLKIVGVLFLLGAVANAAKYHGGDAPAGDAKGDGQTEAMSAKPLPEGEAMFVRAVQTAQEASKAAENDMQKGGIRAAREKALCAMLTSLEVQNWAGQVYDVTSNSDGKGVLTLTISEGVYVKPWNNAVSDAMHNTMIEPNSPLFGKASQLKQGQTVVFSGTFLKDFDDGAGCLAESSLTLDGKISEPEFIFRFSDVSPG